MDHEVAIWALEGALEQEEVNEALLFPLQSVWNVLDEVKFDTPLSRVAECTRDVVSNLDVVMCRLLSGCVCGEQVSTHVVCPLSQDSCHFAEVLAGSKSELVRDG